MYRVPSFTMLVLCGSIASLLPAQEPPSGIEAAAAIEKRWSTPSPEMKNPWSPWHGCRRERPGEIFPFKTRPDPFGRRATPLAPPQPTDPDFIPNEYGTGVVVGPGLILTVGSLLGDESDYYVTTAEHKVYKATVKAADPRSDLAVLAIDAVESAAGHFRQRG